MQTITREEEDRVVWEVPSIFDTPDSLAEYLKKYAPEGSYHVKGYTIAATMDALEAAEAGFARELEASREGAMLHA